MTNLELYAPLARATDPETSHMAASDAKFRASAHRLLALRLLANGPLTDFELARISNLQQTSIGKRRKDCMDAGFVEPHISFAGDVAAQQARRRTPSGSWAGVWRITQKGRDYLATLEKQEA